MYFFCSCRKLRLTSSVYNMYFCTQTKCSSCSIHCNITTTDNSNFFTSFNRCIMVITKRFHQVTSCQIFISREYTVAYFTRDSHKHWKTCSRTDKYSFKSFFFKKLIDCSRFTDNNVCFNFYAKRFYVFNLFFYNFIFWKTEFRNTIN